MQTYLCQVSHCRRAILSGQFLQWKVRLQRVISSLVLGLFHQSVKALCRHVQTLGERVQCQRSQELLDISTVISADIPHPGIYIGVSIDVQISMSNVPRTYHSTTPTEEEVSSSCRPLPTLLLRKSCAAWIRFEGLSGPPMHACIECSIDAKHVDQ